MGALWRGQHLPRVRRQPLPGAAQRGPDGHGHRRGRGFDTEILDVAYRPFDNLSVLATLCADGRIHKTVIASVVDSLSMERGSDDWARLVRAFRSPTLKMASLTIPEKGYNIRDGHGEYFPAVLADMENGPERAESYIGKIAALCHERFAAGGAPPPIALVSMDNCSHNGSRLEAAVCAFARRVGRARAVRRGLCRLCARPRARVLPVEHDRQDHPAAGRFRARDAGGGRPCGHGRARDGPPLVRRAVCQRGGGAVPGHRGCVPPTAGRRSSAPGSSSPRARSSIWWRR